MTPRLFAAFVMGLLLPTMVGTTAYAAATVIPEVNLKAKSKAVSQAVERVQTTRIDREEIKKSPVTSFTDLLKRQQSIIRLTNNSADSSQTALSLRGFGDNAAANSLILIDGFPLTNASLLVPSLNAIPLVDIERIDIIQGSEGTLWGDQAVGGVVNIVTRHPNHFIGAIGAAAGSFDKTFYNALVGSHFDNGFYFKAVGLQNQNDNYREHNHQRDDELTLQSGLDYSAGTINLTFKSNTDKIYFPGGLNQAQYDANPRQATNFTNWARYQTDILQLLSKHSLNDKWLIETRVSHQALTGDGFIYSAFERNELENGLYPRLIGQVWNSKITLGYDGLHSEYSLQNRLAHERASANQNSLYAQVIVPLNSTIDFTVGGRGAEQSSSAERIIHTPIDTLNRVFVSEQGFAFHPDNTWEWFVRRDGNYRFPKANEQTWTPPGVDALNVQTGVSYEAGIKKKTEKQTAQLSVYDLRLKNEIGFDPTQTITDPFGTYRNFDPTERRGVTLSELLAISTKLSLNGQMNFVRPQFISGVFSGKQIPAVPEWNGNLGLTYQWCDAWRVNYSGLYTGKRYASEDYMNEGKLLSGYWLHSVALQYINSMFEVSFEVGNLFDQKYSTYTLFNAETGDNTYYPGAGRTYLLTFKTSID